MSNNPGIPEWLLTDKDPGMCPCGCVGKRKKVNFLEKTLDDVARILRDSVFSEELTKSPGLLQKLDPRVKLVSMFALIGVAGLSRHVGTLLMMYLCLLVLARLSEVPLLGFVKRVWLVVPLFTGVMVLPALFNFVQPGEPLLKLINFGHSLHLGPWTFPSSLYITRQGTAGAILLVIRVGVSVSLAVLLTLTTKWTSLLKALRVLFIPKIFVMVLEMTYRYIFLLLQLTSEMFMARKSRTVGRSDLRENRRFIAGAMGTLFAKSYSMSEEVYLAMVSRGYTGEAKTLTNFRFQQRDLIWSALVGLAIIIIIWGDRQLGI